MAEWLVEEGIGETRAICLDGSVIAAAQVDWPGALAVGQVEDAQLISRSAGSRRGTVRFASGEEALADQLPADASEGATLRMVVTRAAMAEKGRFKRAQARPATAQPRPAPGLAERLRSAGCKVRVVQQFPACDWDDLIAEAATGGVAFAGGALLLSPTPAMTLIDIDGTLPPKALALAAIPMLAAAITRLDLAGSIAIDFPSLASKADRRLVDEALAAALDHWPHDRTAMNGFGLVQLVARLSRPSLLHRWAADPAGAAARQLLRRAERVSEPGTLLLTAHAKVRGAMKPAWEAELAKRSGRQIVWAEDAGLALEGGFAQAIKP